MKSFPNRVTGTALICAAAFGILLSLGGIVLVGASSGRINTALQATLSGISDALTLTGDGLEVAHNAVAEIDATLDSLALTMEGVSSSLKNSDQTFTAISKLLGKDLPNTIKATQKTIESAQTSAKNIDEALTSLSKIPFLGSLVYNPENPLHETLGDISDSLDSVPLSLKNAQKGIDEVTDNLDTIAQDLGNAADSTALAGDSTAGALQVIEDYQTMVSGLQMDVEQMQETLTVRLRWLTALAILLLVWLGLTQVGLLMQGLALLQTGKTHRPENNEA